MTMKNNNLKTIFIIAMIVMLPVIMGIMTPKVEADIPEFGDIGDYDGLTEGQTLDYNMTMGNAILLLNMTELYNVFLSMLMGAGNSTLIDEYMTWFNGTTTALDNMTMELELTNVTQPDVEEEQLGVVEGNMTLNGEIPSYLIHGNSVSDVYFLYQWLADSGLIYNVSYNILLDAIEMFNDVGIPLTLDWMSYMIYMFGGEVSGFPFPSVMVNNFTLYSTLLYYMKYIGLIQDYTVDEDAVYTTGSQTYDAVEFVIIYNMSQIMDTYIRQFWNDEYIEGNFGSMENYYTWVQCYHQYPLNNTQIFEKNKGFVLKYTLTWNSTGILQKLLNFQIMENSLEYTIRNVFGNETFTILYDMWNLGIVEMGIYLTDYSGYEEEQPSWWDQLISAIRQIFGWVAFIFGILLTVFGVVSVFTQRNSRPFMLAIIGIAIIIGGAILLGYI